MWSIGLCQLQMFEKAAKHLASSSSWPFRLVNMTSKTRTQMIISINWHCPIMVINHNKKYAMLELVDVSDVNDNHLLILIVCIKLGSQAKSNMCFCLTLHWRVISSSLLWPGWPSQTMIIIMEKTMIIINSWIVGGLLERRHYSVTLPQKLCHAFLSFRAHHPRHHHHVPRHIHH